MGNDQKGMERRMLIRNFNIMYDLKENWVYMDGCDVDDLNFWDNIYECFEERLGCDLNEMYREAER